MTDRSEADISEAVRECARRCANADETGKCLVSYAVELVAQGWSDQDVEEVLQSARKVLDSIGPQIQ